MQLFDYPIPISIQWNETGKKHMLIILSLNLDHEPQVGSQCCWSYYIQSYYISLVSFALPHSSRIFYASSFLNLQLFFPYLHSHFITLLSTSLRKSRQLPENLHKFLPHLLTCICTICFVFPHVTTDKLSVLLKLIPPLVHQISSYSFSSTQRHCFSNFNFSKKKTNFFFLGSYHQHINMVFIP